VQWRKKRQTGSEKDLLIAYYAEECRYDSEKRFVQQERKCGTCTRDQRQREKEEEEEEEARSEGKEKGKGKGKGKSKV